MGDMLGVEKPGPPGFTAYWEFSSALNSIAENGCRVAKEVEAARRLDSFAFLDRMEESDARPPGNGGTSPPPRPARGQVDGERRKPKRSTGSGEARIKIIAALNQHHKYSNGSVLNHEPIGVGAVAGMAKVAKSTVSVFFNKEFNGRQTGGHAQYRRACRSDQLVVNQA